MKPEPQKNRNISFFFLQLREKRMEAQDCKMNNLIAVLFDFKLDPFRGGIRGVRILQYRMW